MITTDWSKRERVNMFIGGRVLYLRPGKSGGSSVSNMLVKHLEPDADLSSDNGKRNHIHGFVDGGKTQLYHLGIHETLKHMNSVHPTVDINDCFKFATVRDPLTKVYSAYTYSSEIHPNWSFEEFIMTQLDALVTRVDAMRRPHLLRSQHMYTHAHGELFVDDVCRLETFNDDITRIFNKIGFNNVVIPHLNKRMYNYNAHYTSDMANKVREVYDKDYKLLFNNFKPI